MPARRHRAHGRGVVLVRPAVAAQRPQVEQRRRAPAAPRARDARGGRSASGLAGPRSGRKWRDRRARRPGGGEVRSAWAARSALPLSRGSEEPGRRLRGLGGRSVVPVALHAAMDSAPDDQGSRPDDRAGEASGVVEQEYTERDTDQRRQRPRHVGPESLAQGPKNKRRHRLCVDLDIGRSMPRQPGVTLANRTSRPRGHVPVRRRAKVPLFVPRGAAAIIGSLARDSPVTAPRRPGGRSRHRRRPGRGVGVRRRSARRSRSG